MISNRRRLLPQIAAAVALFLLLSAPATISSAQETEDVNALLESAATEMLELQSFHFRLSTPVGKSILADNVYLESVEGDVVRPMSFQASFEVSLAFLTVELSAIGIDTDIWVSNPLEGGAFVQITGEGDESLPPLPFLNPDAMIQEAIRQIQDPVIEGTDKIDGTETTVVSGMLDLSSVLAAGTPESEESLESVDPLQLTLWIDGEHRVVRVEFAGGLLPSEIGAGRIVRRIDLSKFDEPVTIKAPAAG